MDEASRNKADIEGLFPEGAPASFAGANFEVYPITLGQYATFGRFALPIVAQVINSGFDAQLVAQVKRVITLQATKGDDMREADAATLVLVRQVLPALQDLILEQWDNSVSAVAVATGLPIDTLRNSRELEQFVALLVTVVRVNVRFFAPAVVRIFASLAGLQSDQAASENQDGGAGSTPSNS